jgi:CRISPR-associated protein Cmr3
MTTHYFVQPLDVLMIRGNKSFGGAGQHGEAVMPPWPSLFAGAFRSALLAKDAAQLARFATGEKLPGALGEVLGTPDQPGSFAINWLSLAQTSSVANINAALPLPADLVALDDAKVPLVALQPATPPARSTAAGELPLSALLRIAKQIKPESGRWFDDAGLTAHLAGALPANTFKTADLFRRETRLGIALDGGSRTAEDGALYTTEAIAFHAGDTGGGFLVGIEGDAGLLPSSGFLRLGGDGKGATYRRVDFLPPAAPLVDIAATRRFRVILATPGIFTGGWFPDGVTRQAERDFRLQGNGFSARLACAAVPRFDIISGWDLALQQPKTAQRVAPAGSVYWFDQLEGDAGKLAAWVAGGLWGDNYDKQRRAEGFNRAWLAHWKETQ